MNSATHSQSQQPTALICGASFAGLSTAWWLNRLGYGVTIVEIAPGVRKGGTPVDIREGVIDVVRRMGLLDRIAALALPPRATQFLDSSGTPIAARPARYGDDAEPGWEVERDDLLDLLYGEVKDKADIRFGESIERVEVSNDAVAVTLRSGERRNVDLLLGCDGTHSAVRRMCFGDESSYSLFLQNYFSLTVVDRLLMEENRSEMFNVPGRVVMLNTYNGKTDIAFCFRSEDRVAFDRKDRLQQKTRIADHFQGLGWRVPELLQEMQRSDNFYFDQLCQIRMPAWTTGRVALVGDAGYCPSPAAGMGGSMAILGAAALADALQKQPNDLRLAFQEYDRSLRPVVEDIQTTAIEMGLQMFAPATEEALQRRNAQLLSTF